MRAMRPTCTCTNARNAPYLHSNCTTHPVCQHLLMHPVCSWPMLPCLHLHFALLSSTSLFTMSVSAYTPLSATALCTLVCPFTMCSCLQLHCSPCLSASDYAPLSAPGLSYLVCTCTMRFSLQLHYSPCRYLLMRPCLHLHNSKLCNLVHTCTKRPCLHLHNAQPKL
jgi:hypothetical protein